MNLYPLDATTNNHLTQSLLTKRPTLVIPKLRYSKSENPQINPEDLALDEDQVDSLEDELEEIKAEMAQKKQAMLESVDQSKESIKRQFLSLLDREFEAIYHLVQSMSKYAKVEDMIQSFEDARVNHEKDQTVVSLARLIGSIRSLRLVSDNLLFRRLLDENSIESVLKDAFEYFEKYTMASFTEPFESFSESFQKKKSYGCLYNGLDQGRQTSTLVDKCLRSLLAAQVKGADFQKSLSQFRANQSVNFFTNMPARQRSLTLPLLDDLQDEVTGDFLKFPRLTEMWSQIKEKLKEPLKDNHQMLIGPNLLEFLNSDQPDLNDTQFKIFPLKEHTFFLTSKRVVDMTRPNSRHSSPRSTVKIVSFPPGQSIVKHSSYKLEGEIEDVTFSASREYCGIKYKSEADSKIFNIIGNKLFNFKKIDAHSFKHFVFVDASEGECLVFLCREGHLHRLDLKSKRVASNKSILLKSLHYLDHSHVFVVTGDVEFGVYNIESNGLDSVVDFREYEAQVQVQAQVHPPQQVASPRRQATGGT